MPSVMVPIHRYTDVYADVDVQIQPIYDTPELPYEDFSKRVDAAAIACPNAVIAPANNELVRACEDTAKREVLYFDDPCTDLAPPEGDEEEQEEVGVATTPECEGGVQRGVLEVAAIDLEKEVQKYFVVTRFFMPPPPPVTDLLVDEMRWYSCLIELPYYGKCVKAVGMACPPPPFHHSAVIDDAERHMWMNQCRSWWRFLDELYRPRGKQLEVPSYWTWDPYNLETNVRYSPQWSCTEQHSVNVMVNGIDGHDELVRYLLPPPPSCEPVTQEYIARGMTTCAAEELFQSQLTRWWRHALIWAAVFSARAFHVCPPPSKAPSVRVWSRSCAQWYGFVKTEVKPLTKPMHLTQPSWMCI